MKKLFYTLFIITLFFPNILKAQETFEGFASRVESWAEGLNGYVVSSSGASIDLGKNANVASGMEFIAYRDGEKLIHPVTGESLGVKKVITGKIAVANIEQKYSSTKILENKGIKKGDKVEHIMPVPVTFNTNLLDDAEKAQIKYALFKSSALKETASSDYSILCQRENSGADVAKCSLLFKGSAIFSDNIAVKGMKIISTKKTSDSQYKIDQQVYSMAVGFFLGKEKEYLIALADRNSVVFYALGNEKIINKAALSSFAGEVINIESFDINNNGRDEIIVSIIDKKQNVVSQIYEYDGKKMQLLASKIPYLFRSYYSLGKKHLVCQAYSEGSMVGHIFNVSYKEKEGYIYDEKQDVSFGASIYGYGLLDNNILFFNRHGLLSKTTGEKNIVYDNVDFGNTVNYIIYTEKLSTGVNVGETGENAGFFVYDEQNIVVPVYQRILQLANGSLVLSSNKLMKNNIMGSFENSQLGAYFLSNSVTPSYSENIAGTAITDMDMVRDGSEILYIYSKNKNGIENLYMDIIKTDSF